MVTPVFIVMLRRPKKNDRRDDPFYEFGSFGLTGCHCENLLHRRNADCLEGARIAFVQGGDGGARLVCLTPPVRIVKHARRVEVCWDKEDRAGKCLKYNDAPVITDIAVLMEMIENAKRWTPQAKFASKFRTRTRSLPPHVAEALLQKHAEVSRKKGRFAVSYQETLPFAPDIGDEQRRRTWEQLRRKAEDNAPGGCRVRRPKPTKRRRTNECS